MSQIQRQKEPGCQKLRGVTANRYSFTWGKCKSSGDEWGGDFYNNVDRVNAMEL